MLTIASKKMLFFNDLNYVKKKKTILFKIMSITLTFNGVPCMVG